MTFSLPSPSSMLKLPIIESTSGSWKLFGEINVILERKQVCKLTARALKGLKVCLQWKVHSAYTATIYDIRTWVNWVLLDLLFPFPSMLASNLNNSTEKPLQNNIGKENDKYQSSLTQVECH